MKNFILFLLLILPLSINARQRHLEFSHVSLPNYITSKAINTFAEDEKGFLWFGTKKGLFRFDGYNFEQVNHSNVYDLVYDGKGNLWIATFSKGLFKYNIHTEEQKQVTLPFEKFVSYCLRISSNNEVLLGTSKGFCIIDIDTEKAQHFQKIEGLEKGLSSNVVRTIYEDSQQNIWLGTQDKLNLFDRKKEKFTNYRIQDQNEVYKKNNLILAIIPFENEKEDQQLLVGTETGLALFDRVKGTFKKFHHSKDSNSLSNDVIKSLCKVNEHQVWVGTGNGLNIFDIESQQFERFFANYVNHYSISDDIVHQVFKDKNNTIWLGTQNGIDKISMGDDAFLINALPFSETLLEMGTTINKFTEDQEGNIWFATSKSGLIKYDKKSDRYVHFTVPQILHSDVKDVLVDHKNNVWIVTLGGLNVLEHKTNKIYSYIADKGNDKAFSTNYLLKLTQNADGDIWIASMKGLYKVINAGNHQLTFKNFKHNEENKNSISGNFVSDFEFDQKGNLWVKTGNGLDYFNLATGSISHIEKPQGIKSNYINHFTLSGDKSLWIAYGKKIFKYDLQNKSYELVVTEKSQIKNFLIVDHQIWYTTATRLFQFDLASKTKKIFSSQLTGIKSYTKTSMYLMGERILLGGENGYLTFDPKEVKLEPISSSITLTSLAILNKKVKQNKEINGRILLDKPLDEMESVTLSHEENSFTISFSSLDFREDNALQYKVILEGLEDDWQVLDGDRNSVSYIKVKPGTYVFKAIVSDTFGKFHDDFTQLEIVIDPPLWATWWAKIGYFILFCILFYVAHRVTVSNIHFQNQFELEKIKRAQDDEVHQMKLKFFTNVSHELRTPLTLITSPLEELQAIEDDRQKQKLLNIINRNTKRLSRLVNQVLDLRKIDQGGEKLALSNNDMVKLARNIVHDFMDATLQRSINLNFYTSEKESNFMFDFEKIEKVINNLLTNALKYTPDNGEIKVKIDHVNAKHPENLVSTQLCQRITISDSGIGIPKEVQDQIFERFVNIKMENFIGQPGTGIGLSLVNDYVKMHHGWIDMSSEEGKGTEFVVYLPMEAVQVEEETKLEVAEEELVSEEVETKEEKSEGETLSKLLIIDDDADMLSFLEHCFASDYQVITAVNGKEGWDKAKKQMPDLIISDWMMPEMNGIDLCNKLKGNILTNHIPVIILTAKGGMENKMEGIEKGADDYISKPFNVEYLRVRVQNIIQQRVKLFDKIKREFGSKEEEDKMPTFEQKFLNEIIAEIEKNIDNSEFNVKALGECIGMGQTNLYRKVKAMTGMTVNELIRTVRLKKAEQLLKQGEYNVTDVMYMVGFTHRSYFSRSFKDMFGISPKQFTKHNTTEASL